MAIEAACVSDGELAAVWVLVAGLALPWGGDVPSCSSGSFDLVARLTGQCSVGTYEGVSFCVPFGRESRGHEAVLFMAI